jgi:hypothetical protein
MHAAVNRAARIRAAGPVAGPARHRSASASGAPVMLMRVLRRRDRLTEVVSGAWPIRLVAGATLLNGLWTIGQTLLVRFPARHVS